MMIARRIALALRNFGKPKQEVQGISFGRENGPQFVRCNTCGVVDAPHHCFPIQPSKPWGRK